MLFVVCCRLSLAMKGSPEVSTLHSPSVMSRNCHQQLCSLVQLVVFSFCGVVVVVVVWFFLFVFVNVIAE